ncbi:MAG: APC family permease [Phycisphaerales bacterium]
MQVPRDLPRTIGFFGAAGIMVGVTIGSGIFKTPFGIANAIGSPWLILGLWVVGGVLSLFGALTFTELAVMFPRSGGVYNFLREGFGRRVAFTFGWTYMLLTKPFAASAIAVVTIEYLAGMFGRELSRWELAAAVCGELVLLTGLNTLGMRLGAGVGAFLTALKMLAVGAIAVLAFTLPGGSLGNLTSAPQELPLLAGITAAMSAVLWSYDGWSDVGSVAGEVKDPQRTLPRVYLAGTLAVIAIYLIVNVAYMMVIPLEVMRTKEVGEAGVASSAMQVLVGGRGSQIVSAMIVLSTLGATHASIITGARVTFAQSQDGLLYRFLSKVSGKSETPAVALWTQCALSCLAITVLGNFQSLAEGFVFTMWIFYGLAGASIFVLRARQPGTPRVFRCPGYPFVPGLFVLAAFAMTVLSIVGSPETTLPWFGVLALGWPAYWVWGAVTKPTAGAPG